jgi:hypothetical protein
MGARFGLDPLDPAGTQASVAAEAGLALTAFSPQPGFVSTRSDWSEDAIRLDFRCRMDKYFLGHMHPDNNSFLFQALGREWALDPGKYSTPNDYHSTILIDGLGQGGSSANWVWPSLPGKFVEFRDGTNVTLGVGDARIPYTYWLNPVDSGPEIPNPYTYADFISNRALDADTEAWRLTEKPGGDTIGEYNPVQRAFRSVLLVRGSHPYVLVIDDIQKDGGTHDYEWLFNTGTGGRMVRVSNSNTDLVIRHAADTAAGTPRLLIRALEARGDAANLQLVDRTPLGNDTTQVVIPRSNVVAPDYKVLLYPYREGQPLPTTAWNAAHDTLTIDTGSGRPDEFRFTVDGEGRTHVAHARGAGTMFRLR